jgi:hypothetical protein
MESLKFNPRGGRKSGRDNKRQKETSNKMKISNLTMRTITFLASITRQRLDFFFF